MFPYLETFKNQFLSYIQAKVHKSRISGYLLAAYYNSHHASIRQNMFFGGLEIVFILSFAACYYPLCFK